MSLLIGGSLLVVVVVPVASVGVFAAMSVHWTAWKDSVTVEASCSYWVVVVLFGCVGGIGAVFGMY